MIGQIKFACNEIIKIVENRDEERVAMAETQSMATTMEKVVHSIKC